MAPTAPASAFRRLLQVGRVAVGWRNRSASMWNTREKRGKEVLFAKAKTNESHLFLYLILNMTHDSDGLASRAGPLVVRLKDCTSIARWASSSAH